MISSEFREENYLGKDVFVVCEGIQINWVICNTNPNQLGYLQHKSKVTGLSATQIHKQ